MVSTITLRFLTIDDETKGLIMNGGSCPILDLTLKGSKTWEKVLQHLEKKWISFSIELRHKLTFYYFDHSGDPSYKIPMALATFPMTDILNNHPRLLEYFDTSSNVKSPKGMIPVHQPATIQQIASHIPVDSTVATTNINHRFVAPATGHQRYQTALINPACLLTGQIYSGTQQSQLYPPVPSTSLGYTTLSAYGTQQSQQQFPDPSTSLGYASLNANGTLQSQYQLPVPSTSLGYTTFNANGTPQLPIPSTSLGYASLNANGTLQSQHQLPVPSTSHGYISLNANGTPQLPVPSTSHGYTSLSAQAVKNSVESAGYASKPQEPFSMQVQSLAPLNASQFSSYDPSKLYSASTAQVPAAPPVILAQSHSYVGDYPQTQTQQTQIQADVKLLHPSDMSASLTTDISSSTQQAPLTTAAADLPSSLSSSSSSSVSHNPSGLAVSRPPLPSPRHSRISMFSPSRLLGSHRDITENNSSSSSSRDYLGFLSPYAKEDDCSKIMFCSLSNFFGEGGGGGGVENEHGFVRSALPLALSPRKIAFSSSSLQNSPRRPAATAAAAAAAAAAMCSTYHDSNAGMYVNEDDSLLRAMTAVEGISATEDSSSSRSRYDSLFKLTSDSTSSHSPTTTARVKQLSHSDNSFLDLSLSPVATSAATKSSTDNEYFTEAFNEVASNKRKYSGAKNKVSIDARMTDTEQALVHPKSQVQTSTSTSMSTNESSTSLPCQQSAAAPGHPSAVDFVQVAKNQLKSKRSPNESNGKRKINSDLLNEPKNMKPQCQLQKVSDSSTARSESVDSTSDFLAGFNRSHALPPHSSHTTGYGATEHSFFGYGTFGSSDDDNCMLSRLSNFPMTYCESDCLSEREDEDDGDEGNATKEVKDRCNETVNTAVGVAMGEARVEELKVENHMLSDSAAESDEDYQLLASLDLEFSRSHYHYSNIVTCVRAPSNLLMSGRDGDDAPTRATVTDTDKNNDKNKDIEINKGQITELSDTKVSEQLDAVPLLASSHVDTADRSSTSTESLITKLSHAQPIKQADKSCVTTTVADPPIVNLKLLTESGSGSVESSSSQHKPIQLRLFEHIERVDQSSASDELTSPSAALSARSSHRSESSRRSKAKSVDAALRSVNTRGFDKLEALAESERSDECHSLTRTSAGDLGGYAASASNAESSRHGGLNADETPGAPSTSDSRSDSSANKDTPSQLRDSVSCSDHTEDLNNRRVVPGLNRLSISIGINNFKSSSTEQATPTLSFGKDSGFVVTPIDTLVYPTTKPSMLTLMSNFNDKNKGKRINTVSAAKEVTMTASDKGVNSIPYQQQQPMKRRLRLTPTYIGPLELRHLFLPHGNNRSFS